MNTSCVKKKKKKVPEGLAASLWPCLFLDFPKDVQASEPNFVLLLSQVPLTISKAISLNPFPYLAFGASCIDFFKRIFSKKSRNNKFLVLSSTTFSVLPPFLFSFSYPSPSPTLLFSLSQSQLPDLMLPTSPSSGCMQSILFISTQTFFFLFSNR